MVRYPFRSVVITGASSGIGRALAEELAAEGVALGLTGRNADRLSTVRKACEAAGATVASAAFDVVDRDAMTSFVRTVDQLSPVDLVIANAGTMNVLDEDDVLDAPASVATLVATNLIGLTHTVDAALSVMVPRGRGQLGLMGSMSAITPLPHAPTYSATKAAVKAYGDCLRPRLADRGITTTVIIPGFVDTPLDRSHRSPKPFRMTARKSARVILRGLARNRAYVGFPLPLYVGALLASRAPTFLRDWIAKRLLGAPGGRRA